MQGETDLLNKCQKVAGLDTNFAAGSCGQFDAEAGIPENRAEAKRRYCFKKRNDPQGAVEENHVDGVAHEERVD